MTYKGYLIDLDGTIYKGKDRIPEERPSLRSCKSVRFPIFCD